MPPHKLLACAPPIGFETAAHPMSRDTANGVVSLSPTYLLPRLALMDDVDCQLLCISALQPR
jgi:hypothetical protein